MGYFQLHMRYRDLQADKLESVFDGSCHEIVNDEVEWLEDKRFAHRMRFSTDKVLELEFSDLEVKVLSADTMRRLVEKPCRLTIL